MSEIAFTKVSLPFGWMGNMSPHPIEYEGKRWRTAEALFQALRFPATATGLAIREAIRAETSPMAAKFAAKAKQSQTTVVPCSEVDQINMRLVLRLKLQQHPDLQAALVATGEATIIEDCSKRRPSPWGAQFKNGRWVGENLLGKLWMEARVQLQ